MESIAQPLPGVHVLRPKHFADERGVFVKTYHAGMFRDLAIDFTVAEEFYSVSKAGVVRGMHFQLPPHDHGKLVFCLTGRVLDVLVDLRRGENFGRTYSIELSAENRLQLFVPQGVAHGFLSQENDTLMLYKTSTVHAPSHDAGLRWDSFGFTWGVREPIVSKRDAALPAFREFVSPF